MARLLTKHRETVLNVVQSSKDHPTARQVYDRSLKRDPRLSMATVYNSLNFLTTGGYIRRMEAGDEGTRYDGILARHDHLVCRSCGSVEDVDMLPATKMKIAQFPHFQVEEVSLRVMGLCATCRRADTAHDDTASPKSGRSARPVPEGRVAEVSRIS